MNHRARKRFGQNFLHDQGVIHKIIRSINPKPGEHIVEIGPGKGAITKHLLTLLGQLDVIELDRDLVPILHSQLDHLGNLDIHNVDALKFDFDTLKVDDKKMRVVGNLPYNISTPLLFHLLTYIDTIQDMHFMLQKEVVDRIAAIPGSKDYGRLSIMLQYHCTAEKLFDVGPGAFTPQPKIQSAIVRLAPKAQPSTIAKDYAFFAEIVAKCFTQRRKTLRNNLKGKIAEEQMLAIGIDPGIRAETLSVDQFVALSNLAPTE